MVMSNLFQPNSGLPPSMRESPPITFVTKVKKVDEDGVEADRTELIKFDFFFDPENPTSRYSKEYVIFKDGGMEDWIKWLIGYRDVDTKLWKILQSQQLS
jgi:cytochrome oxidase Cu insertion factor (SCO1/SenC/PrrC family)